MTLLKLLSLLPLALALDANPGSRSSARCRPMLVGEQFERATAVFVGRAVSVRNLAPMTDAERQRATANPPDQTLAWRLTIFPAETRLAVESSWKGVDGPEVMILTDDEVHETRFEEGRRYLVFAVRRPSGALGSSLCTGTRPLEHADMALKELGPGKPPMRSTTPPATGRAPREAEPTS